MMHPVLQITAFYETDIINQRLFYNLNALFISVDLENAYSIEDEDGQLRKQSTNHQNK